MKASSSLSCHWKRELGKKVLILGLALYQSIVLFRPACVFYQSARHATPVTVCSMDCAICFCFFLVSTFCNHVVFIHINIANILYVFIFYFLPGHFVVSGMLDLWKQDWLKEHGETPTPPGLWAPAVFVMYHWDLRLPLETLSALPRWHHQGERGKETPFVGELHHSELLYSWLSVI